jgi:molybdopterin converting factor small subunit
MTVFIPTPLRSYTGQKGTVEAQGPTLGDVLYDLDRRYPGLRFRIITEQDTIRQHIRIFVNEEQAPSLTVALRPDDQVYIICALSGGEGSGRAIG